MITELRALAETRPGDDPAYLSDATHSAGLRGHADAIVLPRDAEEVAAVLAFCHEREVALVPRGGGTGYAGGAVPRGGVVLSLERLARVRSFDPLLWRIEVEAGVRTATVARLAREHGLFFGVDPGAAEQSQIGGNVATNAGGPHAFKYGATGRWVTGLEVAVAPGELVRVGGPLRRDVAGYDLRSLLVGSEGTLGVVTSVWLSLLPAPPARIALACAYGSPREGVAAVERLLACGVVPAVVEYLDAGALAAAGRSFPGELAAGAAFLVLTEADTSEADADELARALGPGALRPDPAALWRWRDGVSIAVGARREGKLSEDVAVPLDRLGEGIEAVTAIGERHGLEACSWGHAGDGILHASLLLAGAADRDRAQAAARELFAAVIAMGGTISGEHGVGLLKAGWLARQWDPGAVRLHRAVKEALDPRGVLNPHKKLA